MPRLIQHSKNRPFEIKPSNRSKWICQCGLSSNKPYCDGSHTSVDSETESEFYFYSCPLKNQKLVTRVNDLLTTCKAMRPPQILLKNEDENIVIKRIQYNSVEHKEIHAYRKMINQNYFDDGIDFWSDIYALYVNKKFTASLRCTQARNGKVDMQEFYPSHFFEDKLKMTVCSCSKFFKIQDEKIQPSLIRTFTQKVGEDQYSNGMRIDIINSTEEMIPYYKRQGYQTVGDSFNHPLTNKKSRVMYLQLSNERFAANLTKDLIRDERHLDIDVK